MKTVSDFKKRLKVGVNLQATHHLTFSHRDENGKVVYKDKDLGVREVSVVQSNSFACKTPREVGVFVDSWCAYPKASDCTFIDENTIQIFETDRDNVKFPVLTYKFID